MDNEKLCGIYCIENLANRKKYIGQSVDIKHRLMKHKWLLNNKKHYNSHLQSAWETYGPDGFEFYTVEECATDALDTKEVYYISLYDTTNPDNGCNTMPGGKGVTNEVREKLSKNHSNGLWTEERRRALSAKMSGENNPFFGKTHSVEIREKLSKNGMNLTGANNPMYGKSLPDEVRIKISKSKKGQKPSAAAIEKSKQACGIKHPRHKPVRCIELNECFWGLTDVYNKYGIPQAYISACLSGIQKTAGKHPETGEPLHWQEISDEELVQFYAIQNY